MGDESKFRRSSRIIVKSISIIWLRFTEIMRVSLKLLVVFSFPEGVKLVKMENVLKELLKKKEKFSA